MQKNKPIMRKTKNMIMPTTGHIQIEIGKPPSERIKEAIPSNIFFTDLIGFLLGFYSK